MNTGEISNRQKGIDEDIDKRQDIEEQSTIHKQEVAVLGICYWLSELALQMAEINEHLSDERIKPDPKGKQ